METLIYRLKLIGVLIGICLLMMFVIAEFLWPVFRNMAVIKWLIN